MRLIDKFTEGNAVDILAAIETHIDVPLSDKANTFYVDKLNDTFTRPTLKGKELQARQIDCKVDCMNLSDA